MCTKFNHDVIQKIRWAPGQDDDNGDEAEIAVTNPLLTVHGNADKTKDGLVTAIRQWEKFSKRRFEEIQEMLVT